MTAKSVLSKLPVLLYIAFAVSVCYFCTPPGNRDKIIMNNKVIPVLRIFDFAKAKEFYIDWLGFTIDWEHRFGDNFPVYFQVSREHITLHLSEHHGDCCPGAKIFIEYSNLAEYHRFLIDKDYKFNKPGLDQAFWNALCMEVVDPFNNKLLFSEKQ